MIDQVSGQVSGELADTFASQVRSTLSEELQRSSDFVPERFPKSEQRIRRKKQQ